MPGIVGIIGGPGHSGNAADVERMVSSMMHDPSYSSGICNLDRAHLVSGWVCHAGSFSDCLPIWNEARDVCLMFLGEHYADRSEAETPQSSGNNHSRGNASSLIYLYEKKRSSFFESLNGNFCGVLVDLRENTVTLFNDRYGLGRIYYYEDKDGFYFASEAKALLRVLPHLRQLDLRSFGELFVTGCTLQNRSLFKGITLLPPGSRWTFRPGLGIRKENYFDRSSWEHQRPLSDSEYYEKLRATFTRILPRYFNGAQTVALSLTGGLDSRMIIAGMPFPPGSLPCYTFGGTFRDCEDVRIARQVADLCGQQHRVITVDRSFFPQYLDLAKRCVYITDGTMDVSGSVGLFVNRVAQQFASVRMTGNYGSEILRLNVAFKPMPIDLSMLEHSLAQAAREAAVTYRQERNGNIRSFIAFKQVPWHHYSRFSEENSQLPIRSPYLDNELVRLAYQAPLGLLLHKQLALRYCSDVKPELAGAPTDRGILDRPVFVPEKIYQLWKERWPKAEYYFDYGMPQWLAKVDRVLSPLRPERFFLGQQKYYHFRTWYRHELATFVKEVLLDPCTLSRPYLDGKVVQKMVNAHVNGYGNYTLEIHKLMTSEFIQRLLIEQN